MTDHGERLNRLQVRGECHAAWEEMQGDGASRFCEECRRQVFDFAAMQPAEIHARLQASRGRLCARLTHREGSLVVARETPPSPGFVARPQRRAPALAAGLVTAWLSTAAGVSAGAAAPAPLSDAAPTNAAAADAGQGDRAVVPVRHAAAGKGAALAGSVTVAGAPVPGVTVTARNLLDGRETSATTDADGGFLIAALPSGIYEVSGRLDDFSIESQTWTLQAGERQPLALKAEMVLAVTTVTAGIIVITPIAVHQAYAESQVVVGAVLGSSVVTSRRDGTVEVLTTLRVESAIKGSAPHRDLLYHHTEYQAMDNPPSWTADYAPGSRVIAFLNPSPADVGRPVFESVDSSGLRHFADDERTAFLAHLEALARLDRHGKLDPGALVEWLVATAEDPLTRAEGASALEEAEETLSALATDQDSTPAAAAGKMAAALDRFRAEGGQPGTEPPAALLAALLTPEHQARLTAALRGSDASATSDASRQGDHKLLRLVRRWDEGAVKDWLRRQLRRLASNPAADPEQVQWLHDEADDFDLEN